MGQEPRDIQQEIEETREQMGETVEALAYKADVPARVKDNVNEKKEAVVAKVSGVKDRVVGSVSGAAQTGTDAASGAASAAGDAASSVGEGARRGAGMVQQNPLGLAAAGVAVGFLAGMLLPSTKVEDEHIGQLADQVKQQAKDVGQEALDHGRQIAGDAAQAATQTAKESSQEHAQELRESATGRVEQGREELGGD